MGTVLQDARYALRVLWKNWGFTSVAVVALALGIGANTTIFSAFNALLLRPFNFTDPDSLVVLWERPPNTSTRNSVAPANLLSVREQSNSFSHLAMYNSNSLNLTEGDKPERLEVAAVSPTMFDALGVNAAVGRTFTAEEEQEGRDKVVILTHDFWRRRYATDPAIVNRQLMLNGQPYTVVGVMPEDFNFPPTSNDILIPFTVNDRVRGERGNHYVRVMGRLKPGVTQAQADAELAGIASRLEAQYPETNSNRTIATESLKASYVRGPRPGLLVLLGAACFVLLLACANVANLLLVRAASRQKEIAIRMALGAGRLRLIRQLLTESVLIALFGGALGLLFAVWGIDLITAGIPASLSRYLPGWKNVGIDVEVFWFTLVVSLLTGVVFGLAPALQATKTDFNEALKEGGRTSGGGGFGRNRLRGALVVAEVAISLTLLIGAGLMIKSFYEMLKVEPGFKAGSVLVMDVALPRAKYKEEAARVNFYTQAVERVAALPGVEAAGAVNILPLSRSNTDSAFSVVGRPRPEKGREPQANFRTVSPHYLEVMGIPLRRGRHIADTDRADSTNVILINEELARRHFADTDPIGQRLNFGGDKDSDNYEIIGVVGNIKHESLVEEEIKPEVYRPLAQEPWYSMSIVVRRNAGDPAQLAGAVQREIGSLDKEQPIYNVRTMERVVSESLAPQRVTMGMLGIFALIALVLASVGIYAVMSYTVSQRTHEIGVRMALGASPRDIRRMVVRQGMLLAFVGIGIGLIASYWLMQGLTVMLYEVSATDPLTFGLISLLLILVAFAANYIPARRATRVDPMVALRYE
ncbi:MAG: hypothetical protein QOG71_3664 [Pyrinomonadaceae bacterium]|nr:hypothetical protein [Pyrinomonadaceae bacterium]